MTLKKGEELSPPPKALTIWFDSMLQVVSPNAIPYISGNLNLYGLCPREILDTMYVYRGCLVIHRDD